MSSDSSTGVSVKDTQRTSTTDAKATYVFAIGGDAGPFGGPHEAGDNVPSSVPSLKLKEWTEAGVIRRVQPQPRKDKK